MTLSIERADRRMGLASDRTVYSSKRNRPLLLYGRLLDDSRPSHGLTATNPRLLPVCRRLGNSVASINTSRSEAICYSEQVQGVFNRAWLSCRRLSKSARWRLWCSNSVSSPAHRTVCRSAQDSRSFSCGDGTLRRRIAFSTR